MDEKVSRKPKNLVVLFYEYGRSGVGTYTQPSDFLSCAIEKDVESCQQLLHTEPFGDPEPSSPTEPKPSIAKRLGDRLGLTSDKYIPTHDPSLIMLAVQRAHGFVVEHYALGDQVIVMSDSKYYLDIGLSAVELLVTLLTTGTLSKPPSLWRLENFKSNGLNSIKVPVKGVVVGCRWGVFLRKLSSQGKDPEVNVLNDQLLRRLPLSVEHAISWFGSSRDTPSSCWTKRSATGQIISEEVCFYSSGRELWFGGVLIHASKFLIHYNPECIPDWDTEKPIWTNAFTKEHERVPASVYNQYWPSQSSLEALEALGQKRKRSKVKGTHLALYRWTGDHGTEEEWSDSCLVWKSYYN